MNTKTLYIDEDLHATVKATAAMSKVSIKEWVEAVLRDAIAESEEEAEVRYYLTEKGKELRNELLGRI